VIGPGELNLQVSQATETIDDRRNALGDEACVRDKRHVRAQQLSMVPDERLEARAPALLLALKDALQVDGRRALRLGPGLHRLDVGVELSLVVRCPPCEDVVADDRRLEGRALPEFQRIRGLDIVVTVDQDRGSGWVGPGQLCEDDRMAGGEHHLRPLESGFFQSVPKPVGCRPNVVLVPGLRADAGDAQEIRQFCQEPVLVRPRELYCFHLSPLMVRRYGLWSPVIIESAAVKRWSIIPYGRA